MLKPLEKWLGKVTLQIIYKQPKQDKGKFRFLKIPQKMKEGFININTD